MVVVVVSSSSRSIAAASQVHAGSWKWVFGIALAGLWVMLMVLCMLDFCV